jgi:NADP-dependent 3-hydroxy acid dehydrogenase YdfG
MAPALFEHVLMIGATSGIGQAMAEGLANEGVKVTAVGRRRDRLDAFVQRHKRSGASMVQFDISALDAIPQFARE